MNKSFFCSFKIPKFCFSDSLQRNSNRHLRRTIGLAWCMWQKIHGPKVEISSKSAGHLDPAELSSLQLWESAICRDNPEPFPAGLKIDTFLAHAINSIHLEQVPSLRNPPAAR